MKIKAKIDRMVNSGNVKAIASVSLDGMFVVKNLKIMDGKKGLFVSMPQETYSGKDGQKKYSFTGASADSAPTITLTGEETSVTDSNGVLSNFSFMDGNGAKFYKSGNTLYITQTGDISESAVYKAVRNLPSASESTYRIWYMSGSSYQTTVSLDTASAGSLNAYFKLKAAPRPGSIRLTKTTEDGENLSGWKFGTTSRSWDIRTAPSVRCITVPVQIRRR